MTDYFHRAILHVQKIIIDHIRVGVLLALDNDILGEVIII
jgi:hypothetical protein